MSDLDREHERLERQAEALRARLGHDVEQLAHAPAVETVRAARRSVQRIRGSARWIGPVALGLVAGLLLFALGTLRRRAPR